MSHRLWFLQQAASNEMQISAPALSDRWRIIGEKIPANLATKNGNAGDREIVDWPAS